MLKNPVMVLFCFVLLLQGGMEGLVSTWSTHYLTSIMSMSLSEAMLGLTVCMAAMTVSRFALGHWLKASHTFVILFMSLCVSISAMILLIFLPSKTVAILVLGLLGIGFAGVFPLVLGLIADLWTKLSGTAFSIAFVFALTGNIVTNYVMGLLAHQFSMQSFVYLLLVCLLFMFPLLGLNVKAIGGQTSK